MTWNESVEEKTAEEQLELAQEQIRELQIQASQAEVEAELAVNELQSVKPVFNEGDPPEPGLYVAKARFTEQVIPLTLFWEAVWWAPTAVKAEAEMEILGWMTVEAWGEWWNAGE